MSPRVIIVGGGRKFICERVAAVSRDMTDFAVVHAVSGLSAAHTLYLAGGNILVLDKQGMHAALIPHKPALLSSALIGFFGGNSTKATSGINGALTRTQVDSKITDSVQQFYEDTLKSARDKARPDLIKVLTYKSAAAVEWLQDVFGLDLTLVSRLGYASPTYRKQIIEMLTESTVATRNPARIVVMMPSSLVWPSPTL